MVEAFWKFQEELSQMTPPFPFQKTANTTEAVPRMKKSINLHTSASDTFDRYSTCMPAEKLTRPVSSHINLGERVIDGCMGILTDVTG